MAFDFGSFSCIIDCSEMSTNRRTTWLRVPPRVVTPSASRDDLSNVKDNNNNADQHQGPEETRILSEKRLFAMLGESTDENTTLLLDASDDTQLNRRRRELTLSASRHPNPNLKEGKCSSRMPFCPSPSSLLLLFNFGLQTNRSSSFVIR